jgi:hypothetical protein
MLTIKVSFDKQSKRLKGKTWDGIIAHKVKEMVPCSRELCTCKNISLPWLVY